MEKITSRKNPIAVHMKKLGADGGYRRENGQLFCDGLKLLEEAVKSGHEICTILTASPIPFPLPLETRVVSAPRSLINSLSPLKSPQDIIFSCKMPKVSEYQGSQGTHILLDGIQDPGNLGTIIRTADAFNIRSVIMTGNCADPYNPKTIRASMGAVFRQTLQKTSADKLARLVENGLRLIGSAAGAGSRDISEVTLENSVLAIGSEGGGLSDEIKSLCYECIRIPISEKCESLNASAAASIIMWEASRRIYYSGT